MFIESSGHENATILASLRALTSPSTSRLKTIPETTSELWIPEPFNKQTWKRIHNQTARTSWLVNNSREYLHCNCTRNGNCEEELPKKPVGWLLAICRPTVGQLLVVCRPTVGRQTANRFCPKYRRPAGRQSADSRPTVGNVSVTCRSPVGRLSIKR